ncbi:hypothetical protein [Winogradskyella sp. 4-2091]|uniref:hypothetical protein n=1 Tax=Winogradskyella sp. 4-2091 TaxID=3381659 RepID=UPI003891E72E
MSAKSSNNNSSTPNEIHKKELESTILSLIESTGLLEIDFFNVYDNLNEQDRKQLINEFYHWIISNKVIRHYDSKYVNYSVDQQPNYRFGDFDKRVAENRLPELMESLHNDKLSYRATVCWVEHKKAEINTFKYQLKTLRDEFFDNVSSEPVEQAVISTSNTTDYTFPTELIDKDFDKIIFDHCYRIPTNLDKQTLLNQFQKYFTSISQCFSSIQFEAWLYNSFEFKENITTATPLNLSLISKIGIFKHHLHHLYTNFNTIYGTEKKGFANSLILNFSNVRNGVNFINNKAFKKQFDSLEKSIRKKTGFTYDYES